MSAKRFIDTDVLIYAFSEDEPEASIAEAILAGGGVISVQVLNEFTHVSRRKLSLDWPEIEERLAVVRALTTEIIPNSLDLHTKAAELARDRRQPRNPTGGRDHWRM